MNTQANATLDAVAASLATQPDIRLAMVFGSLAEARAGSDSDLDIAVLGDRPLDATRRMALIETLAGLTGRPVDLVDLKTAGIAVARSAVLGGKVLHTRDNTAYPELISQVLQGPVAVSYDTALRPKIVSAKAQGAGRSHSAVKPCNAGWRDFGPQPEGTAAIFAQSGVAARSCSSATSRSLRLGLHKNSRRRGVV